MEPVIHEGCPLCPACGLHQDEPESEGEWWCPGCDQHYYLEVKAVYTFTTTCIHKETDQ